MTVESLLATVIDQAPNLIVALLVLWWQRTTIDKLLETQRTLIDRLISMVDIVQESDRVVINRGAAAASAPRVPAQTQSGAVTALTSLLIIGLFMRP